MERKWTGIVALLSATLATGSPWSNAEVGAGGWASSRGFHNLIPRTAQAAHGSSGASPRAEPAPACRADARKTSRARAGLPGCTRPEVAAWADILPPSDHW